MVSVFALPAAADTKLTYGSSVPATHIVHRAGLEPFFERVAKDTNGSLTWELFSGGAMGGPKETLQTVKDSVVDSSLIVDAYLRRDLPASMVMTVLSTLADDSRVFAAAANETHLLACPKCVAERDKHNIVGLGFYSTGTYHLMCTKEINTLAAMKGVKVRATSRAGALVKYWGGTPVSVTTSEMYEALQRGQADCTMGATAWLTSYSLRDVIKSIVSEPTGAYFSALFMNMNKDRWNSLSDAERTAIIRNLPGLIADTVYAYIASGEESIAEAVKAGAVVSDADAAMKAKLEEFRKGETKVALAYAKKAKLEDADEIIATFLSKVEKWRKIVAEIDGDKQKYEEALWREIFSKLKV